MSKKPAIRAKAKMTEPTSPQLPLELRAIQCIQSFQAPKTTQDAVDQLSAELLAANLLRTHADKRYEAVKRKVVDGYSDRVNNLLETATTTMTKSADAIMGEDYMLNFSANKPATKVDAYDLRTELVRRGIDVDVIDEAIIKVTKKNKPALIISATRTE